MKYFKCKAQGNRSNLRKRICINNALIARKLADYSYIGKPIEMDDEKFKEQLQLLRTSCENEAPNMKDIVAEIVPTYKRKIEV